ncbi:hypothetical protein D4764_16G0007930 [Takifugu flavidus]|uniref:Uncharacterized protein n=1 Tax=Takifugu flavidus TaxID=433684 RepID=A0A5C6NZM7_9TELE|nr:hypothetical protein D4764_16G0007930 [Takifugu flavidus]
MAVAVTIAAPAVSDEDPPPCLYLPTLVELLMRDHPPSRALCSFLAMFWFWSDWEAEEKELLLGTVLLGLLRFLKDKMACLVLDLLSCFSCHRGAKGDKQPVTMSFSILGGLWDGADNLLVLLELRWRRHGERALYRTVLVLSGVAVGDLPISCLC